MNARVQNAVTGRLSLRPPQAESLAKLVRAIEAEDLAGLAAAKLATRLSTGSPALTRTLPANSAKVVQQPWAKCLAPPLATNGTKPVTKTALRKPTGLSLSVGP